MEKSLEELFKLVHIFLKYLPYFWQNSFFRKCLNKFVQTDTECEQKKILFSVSRLSNSIRIFWHFFSLLFLEEEEKNINSEAVQFATNHLFQDRWWQIRRFFSLVFCNLEEGRSWKVMRFRSLIVYFIESRSLSRHKRRFCIMEH